MKNIGISFNQNVTPVPGEIIVNYQNFSRNFIFRFQFCAVFISHITAIKKWLQRFKSSFHFSNSPIQLLERTVSKPHLKAMFRLDWWLIETAVQTTSNIDRKLASLFRISWGHQSVQFLFIFQHFRHQFNTIRLKDFKYLQLHNHHLNRSHQRTSNGLTLYSNCFLNKMYFKKYFPILIIKVANDHSMSI